MQAVVFDLGGVILESPLDEIRRFEEENSISVGSINRVVGMSGADGAWGLHERGVLGTSEFCGAFESECWQQGLEINAMELLSRIAEASKVRPVMLGAVSDLRARGYRVGALTNNWPDIEGHDSVDLRSYFDVFVASATEGVNKPDPRIYRLMLERLDTPAAETVFLDDIGRNCKAAAELGMHAIKFMSPDQGLGELEAVLSNR